MLAGRNQASIPCGCLFMKRIGGLDIPQPGRVCPALKRKIEGLQEFGRNAHINLGLRNENTNKQERL